MWNIVLVVLDPQAPCDIELPAKNFKAVEGLSEYVTVCWAEFVLSFILTT